MSSSASSSGEVAKDSNCRERRWYNLKDAAKYLGVTIRALEGYVRRKQLRFYKPFGRILFDIDEIDAVISASRKGGLRCR